MLMKDSQEKDINIGTIGVDRIKLLDEKEELVKEVINFLNEYSVTPEEVNPQLEALNTNPIITKIKGGKYWQCDHR